MSSDLTMEKAGVAQNPVCPQTHTAGHGQEDRVSRIEDSDIVITINSRAGRLLSPQMVVFAKDGKELRHIGLIRNLDLKTSADIVGVDLRVEFTHEKPEMSDFVKEMLRKNAALLTEKGCVVKSAS